MGNRRQVTDIDYQCSEIALVMRTFTSPHTALELRDTLAAKIGQRPWITVEAIQRRLNRMAASGRVTIYERSGPRGQHCYGPLVEVVE